MPHVRTRLCLTLSLPLLLTLGACATSPPSGPSFVALPSDGKTFDRFLSEDNYCRQVAQSRSGYSNSLGTNSTAGGAVIGTALGVGAGALLGAAAGNAGIGAAAGAGTGLLAGTAVGAGNSSVASGNVQQNYDGSYAQCMASYGNKVPPPGQIGGYSGAGYSGYSGYYPTYAYAAYPYAYGPGFGFGGFSWGGFYSPFYYGGGFYHHGYYGGYHGGYGGYHGGEGFHGGGFHGGGFHGGGFHGGHR